eukprot:GFUD01036610.1.p1 GENE.GFUD01036610.1~~GFUD01036610.1.p1  ORF type:complete len:423 (+),score=58.41 GFUD01036610.1:52-1320(+)
MSEDVSSKIWCLYGEPDLLANIFLKLGLGDLLSVELVSTEWRNFVLDENIWRRKLKVQEKTSNWKYTLHQHDCSELDHLIAKKLYFHVSSVIISNNIGTCIENNNLVVEHERYTKLYEKSTSISRFIKKVKMYKINKSEENLFFEKKSRTHQTIFKNMPKTIVFYNQRSNFMMSKLLVFGSTCFPILVTRTGAVVMAGSYYGKGRVVVLPHEQMLANTGLMQGAADWVAGLNASSVETFNIAADPKSKAWSRLENDWSYIQVGKRTLPFHDVQFVKREHILVSRPAVYITEGHYDDHADKLLTYVRDGGGLIVGGHAWFWAQKNPKTSLLLNHPGNKLLSNFGIAFSESFVDYNDAKFPIKTMDIPSITYSYYFFSQLRSIGLNYRKDDEHLYDELYMFIDELETKEKFKDIIELNKKSLLS